MVSLVKCPFSLKHPAKTAGARPHRFSSCGRVSMGTPGKENKGTVSEMRLRGDLFLNVQCPLSQDPVLHISCFMEFNRCLISGLVKDVQYDVRYTLFSSQCITCFSRFSGVEAGHPVWSVRNTDDHPGCHLPQHQEKSRLVDWEDAC